MLELLDSGTRDADDSIRSGADAGSLERVRGGDEHDLGKVVVDVE